MVPLRDAPAPVLSLRLAPSADYSGWTVSLCEGWMPPLIESQKLSDDEQRFREQDPLVIRFIRTILPAFALQTNSGGA